MFLFLSLLIACGPKSVPVESLFSGTGGPQECASDSFEPIGSFCIDAIMSYYMDAECNTVRQYGEDIEAGVVMECIDPVKVTNHATTYYITTVESVYGEGGIVDITDLVCMDNWFAVYLR